MEFQIDTQKLLNLNLYVSDKDILSDEDQMRLIAFRDRHRQDYFEIGHIANRYVRDSAQVRLPVTATRIYEAIGRFCGKRPRTIRYYADTAAFYEDKDISDFDMLPFSFFVLAQRAGEIAWRSVLEYAAINVYISLEELERTAAAGQFSDFEKSQNLDAELETRGSIQDGGEPGEGKEDKPRVLSKFAASVLLTTLSDLVEQTLRILRMISLPDDLRYRLELDVQDLKEAIPSVSGHLAQENVD